VAEQQQRHQGQAAAEHQRVGEAEALQPRAEVDGDQSAAVFRFRVKRIG
jgi:hypothetical protein